MLFYYKTNLHIPPVGKKPTTKFILNPLLQIEYTDLTREHFPKWKNHVHMHLLIGPGVPCLFSPRTFYTQISLSLLRSNRGNY